MLVKGATGNKPFIAWANVDPDLCNYMVLLGHNELTHGGWVMHISISKLTIMGSDNGLSPYQHQSIIWTNAEKLFTGPLETNISKTLNAMH